MKGNEIRLCTRVPVEVGEVIKKKNPHTRSLYKITYDIVVAYAKMPNGAMLHAKTISLLEQAVIMAGYVSADELVQDLCQALMRAIRDNSGQLQEGEVSVDNDILDMFKSVINEKELRIHKRL